MKIFVTGAAGFIGSHLAEALAKRGDTVIGVDNFNDYYDPGRKRRNAAAVTAHPGVTLLEADIRDRERMFALFEEHAFDAVAHIAAMAGVRNSVANPALYMDVNLVATQGLMDAARTFGVQNFVFASTSSIYGDTPDIPFRESDPCVRPPQPYAAAKRAAELLGYTYHQLYGLPFTATRFFTVYGPRGRPDMMPGLLAESLFYGRTIPLYEGDMRRDWTYVDDIVAGVVLALDKPLGYEILNLGRGAPQPLAAFIREMERVAGRRAKLEPKPKLPADVYVTYADISKARKLLGFEPKVSIPEGVERFWRWFEAEQRDLVGA
ncbi:GDP-mannose 4,6-dehydratase [Truepera radiovictrix]|uniref:NAD-dependent epimerase/dehydratase n=1 Tax=Truepera radiovictrix (strain DSM 17093 / CIP 108686 / LMG 22925 / RQ-24) TaxID=649638 RepID=D7CUH4_TRURR|nr:GDP-mannose 4,6-dehydratase [Truepera radiovictrix]ADI15759.1 NAD-dependent epimerase/dehydratase [Truepera radiovictrix DSM 17093]WMT58615.1 GDP-mannose 4,6-dehydratase [Truepera radiovictrix]